VNKGTTGVNSLPNTVTRQRRDCDLNPGPSAPESSTLTTRLPSHAGKNTRIGLRTLKKIITYAYRTCLPFKTHVLYRPIDTLEFYACPCGNTRISFLMRCNCGSSGTFRVLVEIKRCIYEIHDILD